MSLKSRKALAFAGVAALAVSGAAATSAQANFQKTLTYSCVYPYVGAQPLKVAIDAAIPASYPAGQLTPKFAINAVATAGGDTSVAVATVGATSIEGITNAKATIRATNQTLPVTVPILVPKQTVASSGDLVLNASGSTPPIKFLNPGPASITVDSIALNLIARTATGAAVQFDVIPPAVDSDGNADTFDVPCKLAPATQDLTLANVNVTNGTDPGPADTAAPSVPGNPSASSITATSASVSWAASSDNVGVSSYDVSYDGKTVSTPGASIQLTGLTAQKAYTVTVKAKDAAGNTSAASVSGAFTTTAASTTPPTGSVIDYAYNAAGSATLKNLVKGSLPLKGTVTAKLQLPSGNFTGELKLNQATGNLTALGFLPVVAKVNIVPTAPITGTLLSGVLKANAKVRIKLPSVTLFGLQLAGGANCQTKTISSINLKSTQPFFYPLSGGPIAGTFAIGDLAGCGFLEGLVSSLTAGSGNAIALNLTPLK